MRRVLRVRLCAALVGLGVLLGLASPGEAAVGCVRRDLGDSWVRYAPPPGLASDVRAAAVSPDDSARVWVTDGHDVLRTDDAGCEWRLAYTSQALRVAALNDDDGDYLTQVLVSGGRHRETTWVVDQGAGLTGPRRAQVFVARSGTDAFTESVGLPGLGDVVLAVGADPAVAYAVVTTRAPLAGTVADQGTLVSALWVTTDTGTSWQELGRLPDGFSPVGAGVTVEGDVLTWSRTSLLRSTEGGAPQPVAFGAGPIAAVSVGTAVVVVPETGGARISRDGGRTFSSAVVPAGVRAIAEVPGTPSYALVVGAGRRRAVLSWVPGSSTTDVTPREATLTRVVGASSASGVPVVVGSGPSDVLVLPLTPQGRPVVPPLPVPPVDVTLQPPALRPPEPSRLVPASTVLSLQPGERRRVRYRLSLPPRPGPLDVYFLMDTTSSMEPSIDGMRESIQDIVDVLAGSGLDVHMGLGSFRDVDPQLGDRAGYVYRREAPIGPPGDALARGLEQLAVGGGGDAPEADTVALTEAVTGAGRGGLVAPGQDAGFRVGSTKVMVLVTDAPMHVEQPVYPSFEEVQRTLGPVRVLGIAVGSKGLADLERVSRDTHGTAPVEGLDCDGDGVAEVEEGAPAVCQISQGGFGGQQLGPAIINLLQSVAQPGRLRVVATGPAVAGVVGPVDRVVDLARPQELSFAVDLACGEDDAGRTLTADLAATAAGRRVVGAVGRVRCLAPPAAAGLPLAVPPQRPQQVAAVLVPPGAPPASAPVGQAQPVTNPQPGTATNPNLMAAALDQTEQQVDVALAAQEAEQLEQLAMVGRPRAEEQAAALRLLAAGLALASVCGAVRLHTRRRTRLVAC